MNEAETRAEYIDPKLKVAGWGEVEGSLIRREFHITKGRTQAGGIRTKSEIADYLLIYKNQKVAVIEAKSEKLDVSEGVAQAKAYAEKLNLEYTYATNGREIYEISMNGFEGLIDKFPTPEELWKKINAKSTEWKLKFDEIPFENLSGTKSPYYYQEIAVNNVLKNIADGKERILLTLATGTGKTFIAFQIAWKLFHSKWNLNKDGQRQPRILFLADRNVLADQAYNSFSAFPDEKTLVRINPASIRQKGCVPINGNIFFTIFQTFMSGQNNSPYFGEYPRDFFDFIIIDECHRGGANDESNWRAIMEYFSPAVQLGLTATPKRKDNTDTYKYFGEPVYVYSLKAGINDGFLTPFKVKRIQTTMDEYIYTSDDQLIEGEVEAGKIYQEEEFNRTIEIVEREAKRVQIFLNEINQDEKAIVFCANQAHAALVRDLVNQYAKSKNPDYCVRVTANDGEKGEQFLRAFQDNENTIPTILTTSQKLSTGVDARNIRNIILMRPVNSMIEFKQIVGRGTRLFDGKEYFTILDFVNAYKHFNDPEWDGEPIDLTVEKEDKQINFDKKESDKEDQEDDRDDDYRDEEEMEKRPKKIKIKLRDGKEREIQHMISTSFWSAEGKPISSEEFIQNLYGQLPELFENEMKLRDMWSSPDNRKILLERMASLGYGKEELESLQKLIDAKDSDLYDVLAYIAFENKPLTRTERANKVRSEIYKGLGDNEIEFIEFILSKYIEEGVDELAEQKLPILLNLKYHSTTDAQAKLGDVIKIRQVFFDVQKALYSED